jgi:thiamine pyrophosphate-dependent acetolactate synthase large subunit-like protein
MYSVECIKALVPFVKDQLVVLSLGRIAEEWADLCPRDGNFFDSGMGHHIPVASGLATALPHRQVIVLDTDGSVLMLLSALTTVAQYPPPNLKIFVFDNEAYEGTGSQPTATAGPTDIAAIARGAGVENAQTVKDVESFQKLARAALTTPGLAFIIAKVELAKVPAPKKRIPPREALTRFVRYVEATEKISIFHTEIA